MQRNELINRVFDQLIKQGGPAFVEKAYHPFGGGLMYQTPDGRCSPIGALIPKDQWKPYLEYQTFDEVVYDCFGKKFYRRHIELLETLEIIHGHMVSRAEWDWQETMEKYRQQTLVLWCAESEPRKPAADGFLLTEYYRWKCRNAFLKRHRYLELYDDISTRLFAHLAPRYRTLTEKYNSYLSKMQRLYPSVEFVYE